MSGTTPKRSVAPPGSDRDPGLHLVEDGHGAMAMRGLDKAREVAVIRQHEADVHHRRLDDDARDLAGMRCERALQTRRGR